MKILPLGTLYYFFVFLSGLLCLTSCSPKNKNREITNALDNQQWSTIDTSTIATWNTLRQQQDSIEAVFDKATNTFSFTLDTLTDEVLHAYIGVSVDHTLQITFVPREMDTAYNTSCLAVATLSNGPKIPLPSFPISHENADSISWNRASQRIQRWNNVLQRQAWIRSQFDQNTSNSGFFQAFVINAQDINYGQLHHCYLALRARSEVDSTYIPDLIIVNAETHQILNFPASPQELQQDLEDMTAPIPPFKPDSPLAQGQFGVLKSLNID